MPSWTESNDHKAVSLISERFCRLHGFKKQLKLPSLIVNAYIQVEITMVVYGAPDLEEKTLHIFLICVKQYEKKRRIQIAIKIRINSYSVGVLKGGKFLFQLS